MNDGDDRIDLLKKKMWESDYTYPLLFVCKS